MIPCPELSLSAQRIKFPLFVLNVWLVVAVIAFVAFIKIGAFAKVEVRFEFSVILPP